MNDSEGFIFNGKHSSELGIIVSEIRIPPTPPIENKLLRSDSADGALDFGVTYSSREIEVDCVLLTDSLQELRDSLRYLVGFLNPRNGVKKLQFNNDYKVYYLARLSEQIDVEEIATNGLFTLKFVCPDPIAFGETRINSIKDSINIVAGGTYETKPKFKINVNKNINSIKITNINNAKYVLINHKFVIGDKVEVDFNDKWKVRKNGIVIAEYVTIESDFFDLEIGENRLSIDPLGLEVEMEYTERWL